MSDTVIYAAVTSITFVLGVFFISWGMDYKSRGLRFPSRYGGTSSPERIIWCGVGLVFISLMPLTVMF